MLRPEFTGKFRKELRLMEKRGKDSRKIGEIIHELLHKEPLERKHRDHTLVGNYVGCRECHVEPDWLLIYTLGDDWIRFERTGTHADLFD
jgi:mRNA interferase YafQ